MTSAAASRIDGFKCPYCPEYVTPTEVLLLTHIRIAHSSDPGFTIRCFKQGCERTFRNFRTYQNHLLSHRAGLEDEREDDEEEEIETNTSGLVENIESRNDYVSLPSSKDIKLYCAKWLLKTSETRSLTRAASIGIVEDVSALIEHVTNGIKSEIKSILTSNQIDNSVISKTEELFTNSALTPFEGLSTFYQQLQYYQENFNLIVSLFIMIIM